MHFHLEPKAATFAVLKPLRFVANKRALLVCRVLTHKRVAYVKLLHLETGKLDTRKGGAGVGVSDQ